MTEMTKGGNLRVTARSVSASLSWPAGDGVPDVDACALLLQADGKVTSDADLVFYNAPAHVTGTVRRVGKRDGAQRTETIEVDLATVPATVDRVLPAASADGGDFGQVPGLRLALSDGGTAAALAHFSITASTDTAVITGELYRRDGGWKFRAVGQGYASGLAGFAGDHGIDVADSAIPGRSAPVEELVEELVEAPVEAPAQWSAPPPNWTSPVAPAPPAEWSPPPPPSSAPPPTSAPAAGSVAPGPVRLQRNDRMTLAGPTGAPLPRVLLELSWLPAPGRRTVDLDTSVIAFDAAARKLAIVGYQHQNEFAGALENTGDARGEPGRFAAERILVDLARLPGEVDALVFTINSFHGHTFTYLERAGCVLSDDTGRHIVTYDLTDTQPSTAVLMATVRRDGPAGWHMRAIGEYHDCRTVKNSVDPAARQVGLR
jgi:stress response protein SCP2